MSLLVLGLFALILMFFVAYVVLELRVAAIARRSDRARLDVVDGLPSCVYQNDHGWPCVTILLPVYNESKVIERLIDSVCAINYPKNKLQVLVLDDSTDGTTALAEAKIANLVEKSFEISIHKRNTRMGYKAGNLANGLLYAKGDFVAVFDADFLPPKDFLYRTIPCFVTADVGYLQTGIDYVNRNKNLLTQFQAMLMGHQQFLTTGLSYEKLMASLSGSSCVWRRTCLESLGGWSAGTVTEDVEIGYKAQFYKWRYMYLRHVVSLSELPEKIDAIRIQRVRWAHGLIHNAFKEFKTFLGVTMTLQQRLHAISLIFSSVLLASFYLLVLLSLPLAFIDRRFDILFDALAIVFMLTGVMWIASNFVGSSKAINNGKKEDLLKRGLIMIVYASIFFPMSLYYFSAALYLAFKDELEFKRTPKGGEVQRDVVNKWLFFIECATFLYSLLAFVIAFEHQNFWLVLFNSLVCLGFGIVIFYSLKQKAAHAA